MNRCVIGAQAILVISIIDTDLDRNRCINQTDNSGGNTNEVTVSSIGGTCKSVLRQ